MNKIIVSRAPLRLGLAGGGTDLPLFSKLFGGSVVNLTIKKYVYCKVISLKKKYVLLDSQDQNKIIKYFFNKKKKLNQSHLNLLENIYIYVRDKYNNNKNFSVKIILYSEVPNGSGLGGSSALVVATLSALLKYLNKNISKRQLVNDAIFLERDICKIPGGHQDQYAAVYGGLNFINFKKNRDVDLKKINTSNKFINLLESSIMLFYYNKKRVSSKVILDQSQNIFKKKK